MSRTRSWCSLWSAWLAHVRELLLAVGTDDEAAARAALDEATSALTAGVDGMAVVRAALAGLVEEYVYLVRALRVLHTDVPAHERIVRTEHAGEALASALADASGRAHVDTTTVDVHAAVVVPLVAGLVMFAREREFSRTLAAYMSLFEHVDERLAPFFHAFAPPGDTRARTLASALRARARR